MGFLKKSGDGHSDTCHEKWGMMCSGDHHMFLRWIVGFFILVFVFSMGYKMGMFTERVAGSYDTYDTYPGYGMMGGGYRSMMNRGYGGAQFQKDGYSQQYGVPVQQGQQVPAPQQPSTTQPYAR